MKKSLCDWLRNLPGLLSFVVVLCEISPVNGATDTWNQAAAGGSWSVGPWNGNSPPLNGDLLLFSGIGSGTLINDLSGLTINGITFDSSAGGFTLTTNGITFGPVIQDTSGALSGGNITNNSANNQTIGFPVTIAAGNHTISNTAAGQLNLSGGITRGSDATIQFTKSGSGNINLIGSGLSNDASGILGGWAMIGLGTNRGDWASLDGSGNVVAYSGYTTKTGGSNMGLSSSGGNAASNIKITSRSSTANTLNGTTAGTYDINTLMWNIGTSSPGGDQTINISNGQVLRLGTNGAIINDHADSRTLRVGNNGGGTITAGGADNANGELTLYANSLTNNNQRLQINAPITNNGQGIVTVNSLGDVVLQQNSTFTGGLNIVNGRIQANTIGALGAGNVYVYPGASVFPWNSGNSGTFTNNFCLGGYGSTDHDSMALRAEQHHAQWHHHAHQQCCNRTQRKPYPQRADYWHGRLDGGRSFRRRQLALGWNFDQRL